jgi:hypothetical protein
LALELFVSGIWVLEFALPSVATPPCRMYGTAEYMGLLTSERCIGLCFLLAELYKAKSLTLGLSTPLCVDRPPRMDSALRTVLLGFLAWQTVINGYGSIAVAIRIDSCLVRRLDLGLVAIFFELLSKKKQCKGFILVYGRSVAEKAKKSSIFIFPNLKTSQHEK